MITKRVALYLRVSRDDQHVENQRLKLTEIAERRRWEIVAEYVDAGISGSKGRDKRPGLDAMLKDASRRKFDMVVVWAIDRLGRNLDDLLQTMKHFEACGVAVYIEQQNIDTTGPMGALIFQIFGAVAQFERAILIERTNAGLARARAQGTKSGKPIGRARCCPPYRQAQVRELIAAGKSFRAVSLELGIAGGTVAKIARGTGAYSPPA